MIVNTSVRARGRPRSFDRDQALGAAALVFWRRGYDGASIADLTEAMGITPQSLYSAFQSKAELYRQALDWYRAEMGPPVREALEASPSAVDAIAGLLRGFAETFSRPDRPGGCMIASAVLACAEENQPIREFVAGLRGAALAAYRARLERALREGELRADADPAALARYLAVIIQGMSVQGRDGASEADLLAVAEIAIAELRRAAA